MTALLLLLVNSIFLTRSRVTSYDPPSYRKPNFEECDGQPEEIDEYINYENNGSMN